MLAKRIIPCLDVDKGRVVKGVKFVGIRDAGDPAEIAKRYGDEGADELTILDISASFEKRSTTIDTVSSVAGQVFIPLTVGGGVSKLDHIDTLLRAGADKVALNTAAIASPDFVKEAADRFGSQCIVVAIDVKRVGDSWHVYSHGGRTDTGIDALEWVRRVNDLGAGELLLTSMDCDGTRDGFDLKCTRMVSQSVDIPVIASGGAGNLQHLVDAITLGEADAVLAASIFHYGEYTIQDTKRYMRHALGGYIRT